MRKWEVILNIMVREWDPPGVAPIRADNVGGEGIVLNVMRNPGRKSKCPSIIYD